MNRAGWYAAGALAALTVAAALGLGRVFDDGSFALPIIGAALLPHAIGAIARARRWPGQVLALLTIAVVVLYVAWVIAPASTTYGFPGSGTFDVLSQQLGDGWDVFRTGRAPVPVTDGVLLLCMVLTATVAGIADALAFRSEATLAAVVPSLLLFVFASTLGTDDLRTATTIGYAIAALVFLMLQHQALLEAHRSWFSGRRLGSHATLVNAAAFVGGVALLSGIVITPALPGSDDGPLIDYRTLGGSHSRGPSSYRTLSPLVDLRGRLTDQGDTRVFTVEAPTRLYWRIAGLDDFDGQVWGIESQARDVEDELGRQRPPNTVRQRFAITGLGDQWLPAAYRPLATDLEEARVVPESGTLVAPDADIDGMTYRVDSEVVTTNPTRRQIAATDAPVPERYESSLELPDDFPARVARQADRIVRGAATPYDKALALQQFFLDEDEGFVYSLDGPDGSGSSAIEDFLDSRQGFCEQFAGAYAAMARAVGLPTRVAVGFSPGQEDNGVFTVLARDAHAWPEVWLAGLGWTQFEPTPAGSQPGQADPTVGQPVGAGTGSSTTSTTTATPTTLSETPNATSIPRGESDVQAGSPSLGGDDSTPRPWLALAIVAGLGVIAGVVWLITRVARKVRRRSRRRRTVVPAHSVAGVWQDALERLTEAGLPPSESLTPHEQVDSYAGRGAPSDATGSLEDLAGLYAMARWSLREPTEEDVARAWSDADSVRDALAEGASSRERVRRALKSSAALGHRHVKVCASRGRGRSLD